MNKLDEKIEILLNENKEIKQKLDILLERTNISLCTTKDTEMIAAKIIKEVKGETIVVSHGDQSAFGKNGKYSYPNYEVGNAELGSSGNPKAFTWPPTPKKANKK